MTARPPQPGDTLTRDQLNRTLLARQHLLTRTSDPIPDVLTHLVGMQSQVPRDPFIGLWSRIEGFRTDDLDWLMLDREAVRHTLMRGTIHLTAADDLFALHPVMAPVFAKVMQASPQHRSGRGSASEEEIVAAALELFDEGPLTAKQLGDRLAQRFPASTPASLATLVRTTVPLVQVTPRGTWNGRQQATFATAESWLARPVDQPPDVDSVIRRYLRAFGPATTADIQAWSGLTGLKSTVDRMKPALVTYRDERGRILIDIPEGVFATAETPAPVRFLPGYDNLTLSHADRSRVIDDEVRKSLWTPNGAPNPVFLVNGRVAGGWKVREDGDRTDLVLTELVPIPESARGGVIEEARRFLAFLVPTSPGAVIWA